MVPVSFSDIVDPRHLCVHAQRPQVFDIGVDDPVKALAVIDEFQPQRFARGVAAQTVIAHSPTRLIQQGRCLAQIAPVHLPVSGHRGHW